VEVASAGWAHEFELRTECVSHVGWHSYEGILRTVETRFVVVDELFAKTGNARVEKAASAVRAVSKSWQSRATIASREAALDP
jgi:hypothetical protein